MFEILENRFKKLLLDISRCYSAIPFLLLDRHYSRSNEPENDRLAIIKLDEIGDYILFRNFLEFIRHSKKYENYSLALIGNIIWKDITEHFDNNFIDEFIWIDKNKLVKSFDYRKNILQIIYDKNFKIIINPLSSRNFLLDDSIIKASSSKERIGYFSDNSNSPGVLNKIGDKYYTRLLKLPENYHFEFDRNKFFFENLLDEKIQIKKTFLKKEKLEALAISNKYIVIFPGASKKHKRWPVEKFVQVSDYIIRNFNYEIIILGGKDDIEIARNIIRMISHVKILDLTGKTNLIELINYIGNAELLISNDTSAAHIGAATNVNTIIISDGSRFGRFIPYTAGQSNVKTIFPPEIMKKFESLKLEFFYENFKYKSSLDINDITSESVIDEINKFIKK